MPNNLQINFIISTAGLGVCVSALAPEIDVPFVVVFAVGVGIILSGVFRALGHIQSQIKWTSASS